MAKNKGKPSVPDYAWELLLDLQTIPDLQPQQVEQLPPKEWAEKYATIVVPNEGRVPIKLYDYQAELLEDISPQRIILKARQIGVSNIMAIEAVYYALTRSDQTILFVSRNEKAAQELIRYCQHTLSGLPTHLQKRLTIENQSELGWEDGSRIISLPSTPSTGRSIAAGRVYLDEYAFCEYDDLVYKSIVPTLSHGGQLTVLSTPNGVTNLFYRLWEGLEGANWSKHEFHWSRCPRYTTEWAENMRKTMTKRDFAQEYDCDFQTSGEAVFKIEDLQACRESKLGEMRFLGEEEYAWERIITAWDIGRRQDHTVGTTWGLYEGTWHLLKYERFIASYPVIQAKIELRQQEYPTSELWVESNGIGDPVIENLDPATNLLVQRFTTTAKTKVQAIQALLLLIEQRRLKHDEEQLHRELSLYQWQDKGLVQDSVMSAAIAAQAMTKGPLEIQIFL